jgi:GT2 family glycosyltransferase
MKEISILLPSLRPELIKQRIEEFAQTNPNVDYEIIVVSPFRIEDKNVKWIKDDGFPNNGSVMATQLAYYHSNSNYVMYFSDKVIPTKNCLTAMLNYVKLNVEPFIGAFKMIRSNGKEIGAFKCYNKLYACYGCMSKKTVELIGGFWDTNFYHSWADIDISLRCWEAGGKVEVCQNAIVKPIPLKDKVYKDHRSKTWDKDVEYFLNKWHYKLGKGFERRAECVNNPKKKDFIIG